MSEDTKVEQVKLSDIKPDARNANKGTERGRYVIETSMREYGFADAGTLDRNNRIIGGNKRTEVAAEIGLNDEAIIVDIDGTKPVFIRRKDLDLGDPEDTRARMLAYALNRSQQLSLDFDPEIVAEDLTAGLDLSAFWQDFELDEIFEALQPEPTPGEDTDPERGKSEDVPEQWAVMVQCKNEFEQIAILQKLSEEGYTCHALIS